MLCHACIEFEEEKEAIRFRCQLPNGHTGPHQEKGDLGIISPIPYTIIWESSDTNNYGAGEELDSK
jgi:hypothetical protein